VRVQRMRYTGWPGRGNPGFEQAKACERGVAMTNRARFIVPAVVACVLGSSVWAAEGAPEGQSGEIQSGEPQLAVWTDKELTFVYQGFTTRYSCDGLRDKVRGVLLDLGVQKKGLKVMELGCSSPSGRPDPFPGVRVKMKVLQPAGSVDPKQTDQIPVTAHWQPLDLKLRDSFSNDSGECELVEQIRHSIVPLFATRNVDLQTSCIPHQASATRPSLKMQVLVADDAQHPAGEPQAAR
jgi:hypothetical protein